MSTSDRPWYTEDWAVAAWEAFTRRTATDHTHERHPHEDNAPLARLRAVLSYKLLVQGDLSVEPELVAIESYFSRFERLALAGAEWRQRELGYDRGPAPYGDLETPPYPTPQELEGLHFCPACQRLGRRGVWPNGPGHSIT